MKIITYGLSANCYLVYDEKLKKACLTDPAVYDLKIEKDILSKGLAVEYIILTHGHFDHIMGANAFREKTGAKIAAHELETEYLENPDKSMTGGETVFADIKLRENDVLTFGSISLKVLHTPGHTKGSCCFISESEKVMFSGDTVFKRGVGRYDLYGGNYNTLLDSLRKIKAIKENYKIYPGHGGRTSLDDEIVGNVYFR
jgi:glyoxylase-like metal-dependent hydrolase (beta-lactamase superfamily II)